MMGKLDELLRRPRPPEIRSIREIRTSEYFDTPVTPPEIREFRKIRTGEWYDTLSAPPAPGTDRPVDQTVLDAIKAGRAVRVWSHLLGQWLVWCRDERERRRLLRHGVKDPVFTLGELVVVADSTREDIRNMSALKREFSAVITKDTDL